MRRTPASLYFARIDARIGYFHVLSDLSVIFQFSLIFVTVTTLNSDGRSVRLGMEFAVVLIADVACDVLMLAVFGEGEAEEPMEEKEEVDCHQGWILVAARTWWTSGGEECHES